MANTVEGTDKDEDNQCRGCDNKNLPVEEPPRQLKTYENKKRKTQNPVKETLKEPQFKQTSDLQRLELMSVLHQLELEHRMHPDDLHGSIFTGVSCIDTAMQSLTTETYPKLAEPIMLMRGLKQDLSFPPNPLSMEQLLGTNSLDNSEDNSEQLYQLALHAIYGKGLSHNLLYAVILLKKVARRQPKVIDDDVEFRVLTDAIPKAQTALAALYTLGVGVMRSFTLAVYWLSRAASNDYSNACARLGVMYSFGLGCYQNVKKSMRFLDKVTSSQLNLEEQVDQTTLKLKNQQMNSAQAVNEIANMLTNQELISKEPALQELVRQLVLEEDNELSRNDFECVGTASDQRRKRFEEELLPAIFGSTDKARLSDFLINWINKYTNLQTNPPGSISMNNKMKMQSVDTYLSRVFGVKLSEVSDLVKMSVINKVYSVYDSDPRDVVWSSSNQKSLYTIFTEFIPKFIAKMKNEEPPSKLVRRADFRWRICMAYLQQDNGGKRIDVESFLKNTMEQFPREKNVLIALALYYKNLNKWKDMLNACETGLILAPRDSYLLLFKADALYEMINAESDKTTKMYTCIDVASTYEKFLDFTLDSFCGVELAVQRIQELHSKYLEEILSADNDFKAETTFWIQHFTDLCHNLRKLENSAPGPSAVGPKQINGALVLESVRKMKQDIKELAKSATKNALVTRVAESKLKANLDYYSTPQIYQLTETTRASIVVNHRKTLVRMMSMGTYVLVPPTNYVQALFAFGTYIPSNYTEIEFSEVTCNNSLDFRHMRFLLIEDPVMEEKCIRLVGQSVAGCVFTVVIKNIIRNKQTEKRLVFGNMFSILNPRFNSQSQQVSQLVIDDPRNLIFYREMKSPCRYCIKERAFIACSKCERALYCDEECLENDKILFKHDLICCRR